MKIKIKDYYNAKQGLLRNTGFHYMSDELTEAYLNEELEVSDIEPHLIMKYDGLCIEHETYLKIKENQDKTSFFKGISEQLKNSQPIVDVNKFVDGFIKAVNGDDRKL